MKHRGLFSLLAHGFMICALLGVAHAQNVVGDWSGTVSADHGSLHINLHITKGQGGELKATIDSVDEGAMGVPVKSIVLKGSELTLDVAQAGGTYKGNVNRDSSAIVGTWTKDQSFPLTFSRNPARKSSIEPRRPRLGASNDYLAQMAARSSPPS